MKEVTCGVCECFATRKDGTICLNFHNGTNEKFLRVTADFSCIDDLKRRLANKGIITKGQEAHYKAKIRLLKNCLNYYKD